MSVQSRMLLLLCFLLVLHGIAIFLFTSGFLLTRTELPNVSSCRDVDSAPCGSSSAECWTSPGAKRAIVIIIDALRFDFLAKSDNFPEPKPWMDRLSVLQRLAEDDEGNARIFKYVADPPTTTLQRLKGLTTGGLPTFIDVGHSFGASAIVEDNIILQLAQNGKRVVMMGDDTWLQLFPTNFSEAYPFPSFNVKDLHTVDNGVISNIFPMLKRDDWDVLIAHFLGVDHVGHIFGVESPLMVEKLEQYNTVLKEVISYLKMEAHSGGRHEDTLLIVMGDHGQTLHGDHGGGTPEEVETGLFAMSMGSRGSILPADLRSPPCNVQLDSNEKCISTLPQLDFAASLASILGIPIPFGSVGRVNAELLSLVWPANSIFKSWLEHYRKALCINCWQVNRYLLHYAASALKGIPAADLSRLKALYDPLAGRKTDNETEEDVKSQIAGYISFLHEAATLARSQWTQFGDVKMVLGLSLLILSVPVHAVALLRISLLRGTYQDQALEKVFPLKFVFMSCLMGALVPAVLFSVAFGLSRTRLAVLLRPLIEHFGFATMGAAAFGSIYGYMFASDQKTDSSSQVSWWSYAYDLKAVLGISFVFLHALSLLSNSFIMAEGHVASFLLATIGVIHFRTAVQSQSKIIQAILFLVLNRVLSGMGLLNIVKDTMEAGKEDSSGDGQKALLGRSVDTLAYVVPLTIFSWLAMRHVVRSFHRMNSTLVPTLTVPIAYSTITAHWLISDLRDMKVLSVSDDLTECARLQLPRFVYISTLLSTGLVYLSSKLNSGSSSSGHLTDAVVSLFGSWSACILLLLGRKAPLVGFLALLEVWCIVELQGVNPKEKARPVFAHWNFLALLIFFCTNHRCTFDGLRYPAAFIGFDDFNIYRQGALLAIDTYGASHILPILGLPSLVVAEYEKDNRKPNSNRASDLSLDIAMAYLSFGLVRSITTTFSTICVALQRRHLMVWGLFAPKYVFDAIGLLFTDVLFVAAGALYFSFM